MWTGTNPEAEMGQVSRMEARSESEQRLLDGVDRGLSLGLELKEWWEDVDATEDYATTFALEAARRLPRRSFGFTDRLDLDGVDLPVMGSVQELIYDQPKVPHHSRREAARWIRDQVREFALRYFLRVSDFSGPEPLCLEPASKTSPGLLRPISWCPGDPAKTCRFGFSQHFYKLAASGEIGRFSQSERYRIVDLRELGATYDWIVLKVKIFDADLDFSPLGSSGLRLVLPASQPSYLVLAPELVLSEDRPREGELGRYGFSYAFLPDPTPGVIDYGPGCFDAGFQSIRFAVSESGVVRVCMSFVANRPKTFFRVSMDPLRWGMKMADMVSLGTAGRFLRPVRGLWERLPNAWDVDPLSAYILLANTFSGGAAGRELCISQQQLERRFLLQHVHQQLRVVAGSLVTWRQVSDWLDPEVLPEWVTTGMVS